MHDDLVERKFSAVAPNLLWLTDFTEHPTAEGKLYCCAIKDVFSNRIVGYSCADRMTRHLAVRALRSHRPPSTTRHRDRSQRSRSQFRSRDSRAVLKAAQLSGSMGRVAAGAPAASSSTRSSNGSSTYNRRRKRGLGKLTSTEFELAFTDSRPGIGFKRPPDAAGMVEIGYSVLVDWRRRGYVAEAAAALVKWALARPNVRAVVARCDHGNAPLIRTLERAGFHRSGEAGGDIQWRYAPASSAAQ